MDISVTKRAVILQTANKLVSENIKVMFEGEEGQSGAPIEVPTSEEMTSILYESREENLGKLYLYTGETDDTYTQGTLYILERMTFTNPILVTADGNVFITADGETFTLQNT